MSKPGIPQGTRDFSPEVVRKRNFILSTIRRSFETYGFEPLETPAMENLETLMGKYGEEGDKLIFKVLNNGLNNPKNTEKARTGFEKLLEGKSSPDLTERALKYDLTIPFARYVAMNHGRLTLPFRRYQVQPVWRADRPQKGRYREFTQCDADVVGSNSLVSELELAHIYHQVFNELGLWDYQLKVNSRKILSALATLCGGEAHLTNITIAIDKLDKIGLVKVMEELEARGLTAGQQEIIAAYLNISGTNTEKMAAITELVGHTDSGKAGIREISFLVDHADKMKLEVDFTLARGLNYYTGIIFEVKAPPQVQMGSIGGGGRYDDLTGLFGVPGIPGVGISFGVDRIYDVLEELDLFPATTETGVTAVFFNMGEHESMYAFGIMQMMRDKGISCELYTEHAKIAKQFNYAEKKKALFAVIIGSKEIEQHYAIVKELSSGEQEIVVFDKLTTHFKQYWTKN